MTRQPITEAVFDSICREASVQPISSYNATQKEIREPMEDYLYTVWLRTANHVGWDPPMLFPKGDSQSYVGWLRDAVLDF